MERLYNKDMKNIEKMKQELLAEKNKVDIVDLNLKITGHDIELKEEKQNKTDKYDVAQTQVDKPKAPDYSKIQLKRGDGSNKNSTNKKKNSMSKSKLQKEAVRAPMDPKPKINESISIFSSHLKMDSDKKQPNNYGRDVNIKHQLRSPQPKDSSMYQTLNPSSIYSSVISQGSNRSNRSLDYNRPRRSNLSESKQADKIPGAVALPRN